MATDISTFATLGETGCFWVAKIPLTRAEPRQSRGVPGGMGVWGQHVGLVVSATVVLGSLPLCLSPVPQLGFEFPSAGHRCHEPTVPIPGDSHQELVSAQNVPFYHPSVPQPPCRLW